MVGDPRSPTLLALGVVLGLSSLLPLLPSCTQECGKYTFALPGTKAFYEAAGSPELVPPGSAFEECGDFGSQGYWDVKPGQSQISFEPAGGRSSATFGDMLLNLTFATAAAKEGATLTGADLAGTAYTGLGTTHRDVASLTPTSTVTFHAIGPVLTEDVFDRRVIDVSWDLVWEMGGARYAAKGRDTMDMAVTKAR